MTLGNCKHEMQFATYIINQPVLHVLNASSQEVKVYFADQNDKTDVTAHLQTLLKATPNCKYECFIILDECGAPPTQIQAAIDVVKNCSIYCKYTSATVARLYYMLHTVPWLKPPNFANKPFGLLTCLNDVAELLVLETDGSEAVVKAEFSTINIQKLYKSINKLHGLVVLTDQDKMSKLCADYCSSLKIKFHNVVLTNWLQMLTVGAEIFCRSSFSYKPSCYWIRPFMSSIYCVASNGTITQLTSPTDKLPFKSPIKTIKPLSKIMKYHGISYNGKTYERKEMPIYNFEEKGKNYSVAVHTNFNLFDVPNISIEIVSIAKTLQTSPPPSLSRCSSISTVSTSTTTSKTNSSSADGVKSANVVSYYLFSQNYTAQNAKSGDPVFVKIDNQSAGAPKTKDQCCERINLLMKQLPNSVKAIGFVNSGYSMEKLDLVAQAAVTKKLKFDLISEKHAMLYYFLSKLKQPVAVDKIAAFVFFYGEKTYFCRMKRASTYFKLLDDVLTQDKKAISLLVSKKSYDHILVFADEFRQSSNEIIAQCAPAEKIQIENFSKSVCEGALVMARIKLQVQPFHKIPIMYCDGLYKYGKEAVELIDPKCVGEHRWRGSCSGNEMIYQEKVMFSKSRQIIFDGSTLKNAKQSVDVDVILCPDGTFKVVINKQSDSKVNGKPCVSQKMVEQQVNGKPCVSQKMVEQQVNGKPCVSQKIAEQQVNGNPSTSQKMDEEIIGWQIGCAFVQMFDVKKKYITSVLIGGANIEKIVANFKSPSIVAVKNTQRPAELKKIQAQAKGFGVRCHVISSKMAFIYFCLLKLTLRVRKFDELHLVLLSDTNLCYYCRLKKEDSTSYTFVGDCDEAAPITSPTFAPIFKQFEDSNNPFAHVFIAHFHSSKANVPALHPKQSVQKDCLNCDVVSQVGALAYGRVPEKPIKDFCDGLYIKDKDSDSNCERLIAPGIPLPCRWIGWCKKSQHIFQHIPASKNKHIIFSCSDLQNPSVERVKVTIDFLSDGMVEWKLCDDAESISSKPQIGSAKESNKNGVNSANESKNVPMAKTPLKTTNGSIASTSSQTNAASSTPKVSENNTKLSTVKKLPTTLGCFVVTMIVNLDVVKVSINGRTTLIPVKIEGSHKIPCCLSFAGSGLRIGAQAKQDKDLHSEKVISGFLYSVTKKQGKKYTVETPFGMRRVSDAQALSMFMALLAHNARKSFGSKPTSVYIETPPLGKTENATLRASCEKAGLTLLGTRIMSNADIKNACNGFLQ